VDALISALKAVADPSRLRLLALLRGGELTVSELVHITGQSQPRLSRHLKLLNEAGLLERIPEGSWVFYRIPTDLHAGVRGADLARCLLDLVDDSDPVIARDQARLKAVMAEREREAEGYFQSVAGDWDRLRSLHVDEAVVEDALASVFPDGAKRFLDIGTGTGRMLELFAPRTDIAEGVDRSHEMLTIARAHLERAEIQNATVRQADLFQLPCKDGVYDVAIIHQVLHFLDRPGDAIIEAARVLKPGGRLIVVDFAPHDVESLRSRHAHRRLGFLDKDIVGWFHNAHLKPGSPQHLIGNPLTVSIWQADHE